MISLLLGCMYCEDRAPSDDSLTYCIQSIQVADNNMYIQVTYNMYRLSLLDISNIDAFL